MRPYVPETPRRPTFERNARWIGRCGKRNGARRRDHGMRRYEASLARTEARARLRAELEALRAVEPEDEGPVHVDDPPFVVIENGFCRPEEEFFYDPFDDFNDDDRMRDEVEFMVDYVWPYF